ncbi:uncharacterized protein BO97DRAFT_416862 [Aspergillus homomorphus CBS 101889]|uniref:AAA+ ATPase domain-containing protein n=1 Tax=Aspergillus homomorphus (strain CBS 101889) TaxID=1450537 RepID=A0A395HT22_ASPHC|nr:hypothetical protein BO97DRAFT_416862 [Aspergillus homomorphus CBS 101889]RAL09364.1 hypothetical protein BO97DRAFT_416862 [Aspergillus homomorphus CBS 101889]
MMESLQPTPYTEVSQNFDATAPSDSSRTTPHTSMSEADRGKDGHPASPSWLDELHFLKNRIAELEHEAQKPPDRPKPEETDYQRWENCLYHHRKQWERNGGPGQWSMASLWYNDKVVTDRHGPWNYNWPLAPAKHYKRPDPFDPAHACASHSQDPSAPDEFDTIIDFESRRQRLRKGFEWEMDRLYLQEEVDRRRRERLEDEAMEPKQPSGENQSFVDDKQQEECVTNDVTEPAGPEPRLNRVEWWAFRRLANLSETEASVIDILVGEPIIENEFQFGWFRYPGLSGRKGQTARQEINGDNQFHTSSSPTESAGPERIRIHSTPLTAILAKILSKAADDLAGNGSTFVLVRPFKALVHCERGLREWFQALERRIVDSSALPKAAGPEAEDQSSTANNKRAEDVEEDSKEKTEAQAGEDKEEEPDEDEDKVTTSPTALRHLQCILDFINTEIVPRHEHLRSPQCRKVFFTDLWHLFRPGTEVIGSDGKQVYRVIEVSSPRHRVVPSWQRFRSESKKSKVPLSVTCVYIDFNGTSLGPVSRVFEFKRFEGAREVTALEIYPLKLHPLKRAAFSEAAWKEIEALAPADRADGYREQLIARGRQFLAVAGIKHMYYAGPTLGVRDDVESQVVIDFETAFSVKKQQEWKPILETLIGGSPKDDAGEVEDSEEECRGSCCARDAVPDDTYIDQKQRDEYINSLLPKSDGTDDQPSIAIIPRSLKDLTRNSEDTPDVTPEELLIMSYRVFGFVLRTRSWAQLDLTYLSAVKQSEISIEQGETTDKNTIFGRLVIDQKHKRMIESLVAQHFRDKRSNNSQAEQVDLVRGKGKGLIMLLHGAPGVGKTSTAEGIAELFQKPLFQITCGDLGTTAPEVEKALETTFSLANRWNCVLLLDEADVFLAQRTKEDFKRNGLVAVFLRVMEYYAGILFLTTNRVGDFDEAFTSRIHVSLYYPELDSQNTVAVFELNLKMIEKRFRKKGRAIDIDSFQIARFAGEHFNQYPKARWNGRQIRNACHTALALAEFEAQGNNRREVLKPEAIVRLSVEQFEIVRDAYVNFTKYINDLYGVDAARRAHEDKLRTIRHETERLYRPFPNDKASSVSDLRASFARAGQPQSQDYHYPTPTKGYASAAAHPQHTPRKMPPSSDVAYYQHEYEGYAAEVHRTDARVARDRDRDVPPTSRSGATGPNHAPPPPAEHFSESRPSWFDRDIASLHQGGNPQGREIQPSRSPGPPARDIDYNRPIGGGGWPETE